MSGTRMISGFQCWQTKINVAIADCSDCRAAQKIASKSHVWLREL